MKFSRRKNTTKKEYAKKTYSKCVHFKLDISLRWHYPNQVYGRNRISSQPVTAPVLYVIILTLITNITHL